MKLRKEISLNYVFNFLIKILDFNGFKSLVFNTDGDGWPDTDVTIVDLATFAREGYNAQLAIAYTSRMMRINNLAEKHQHDERPIVMLTDEGGQDLSLIPKRCGEGGRLCGRY